MKEDHPSPPISDKPISKKEDEEKTEKAEKAEKTEEPEKAEEEQKTEEGSVTLEFPDAARVGHQRFEFISVLGEGGMGEVHLARNKALDRIVAVKFIRQELSGGKGPHLQRFLREAQNTAALEHPNIVTVYSVGEIEGTPYLEMQYVEGHPLSDFCIGTSLPIPKILRHVYEVAQALAHAHKRGIVHRDIKPSNILMDTEGHVKVVDFGLSLASSDSHRVTRSGIIVGSLHYLSPELWDNQPANVQSDLYALGITMFQLLTGCLPFEGSLAVLAQKHLFHPLPPLRELNPGVPLAVSAIVRRLTAKQPEERYASAEELLAALEHVLPELGQNTGSQRVFKSDFNPYRGLSAFQAEDAPWFFGRDALVGTLLERVEWLLDNARTDQTRMLCVCGPSGVGKSSLVRAGLAPRLRGDVRASSGDNPSSHHTITLSERSSPSDATGISEATLLSGSRSGYRPSISGNSLSVPQASSPRRVIIVTPGGHPLEALARAFSRSGSSEDSGIFKLHELIDVFWKPNSQGCHTGIRLAAHELLSSPEDSLVLVFDQFEEVFTLCKDTGEVSAFIAGIMEAATDPLSRVAVLLTLRSDFLDETRHHPELNRAIAANMFVVPVMSEQELRAAISEPAALAGFPLDEGIVAQLLAQVHARTGALPLLQFALLQIWEGLRQGKSPTATLDEIGGVGGSLAQVAEGVYNKLLDPQKLIARRIFIGLVQLGEGVQDSRRRTALSALIAHDETVEDLRPVLRVFSQQQARLITLSRGGHDQELSEITHETLIQHWKRLRDWLDEAREDIRFARTISIAAAEWLHFECPSSLLWQTPKLDILREYSSRNRADMTAEQVRFFEASEAHREAEALALRAQQDRERTLTQRLRRGVMVLAGLSVLALSLTAVAIVAWQNARGSAAIAESAWEAEQVVAYRAQLKNAQVELSNGNLQEARRVLDGLIPKRGEPDLRGLEWTILRRHVLDTQHRIEVEAPVGGVAASSDGEYVAFATLDGRVSIWSFATQQIDVEMQLDPFREISAISFSLNSKYLAISASYPGPTRVQLLEFDQHIGMKDLGTIAVSKESQAVYGCGWTQAGQLIINTPNGLQLHTPQQGTVPLEGVNLEGESTSVGHCLLQNGKNLILQRPSGAVEVWDISLAHPRLQHLLSNEHRLLTDASADGSIVLLRDDSNFSITRVDFESGYQAAIPGAPGVNQTVLAPEGDITLTLRRGRVSIWLPHWYEVLQTSIGATRACITTQKSTGERLLIKGDLNGVEILQGLSNWWELQPQLHHEQYRFHNLAVSSSGRWLALAGDDFKIHLLESDGTEVGILAKHTGPIFTLAFSPDESQLISAGEDHDIAIWDIKSHRLIRWLKGHRGAILSLAVSPDGQRLASGGNDRSVRVWSMDDGSLLTSLKVQSDQTTLLFSKDSRLLWSGDAQGQIMSWDVKTWERGHPLDLGEPVVRMTLSPDGKRLVALSAAGGSPPYLKVWSLPDGSPLLERQLPMVDVNSEPGMLAYSEDGNRLLLGLSASLWVLDSDDLFLLTSFPGDRANDGFGQSMGAGISSRRPKPTPYVLEPGGRSVLAGPSGITRYPLTLGGTVVAPGNWSRHEESAHPSTPINMDLADGPQGGFPPGWLTHPGFIQAGFTASIVRDCDNDTTSCILIQPDPTLSPYKRTSNDGMHFNLFQRFLAKDYRGKKIRFAGEAKLGPGAGYAHPWVRVDRTPSGLGFFDNMPDHALMAQQWTAFEIVGRVNDDAMRINMGVMAYGSEVRVWLRRLSLEVVEN